LRCTKIPEKHLYESQCRLSRDQGRSHLIIAIEGPQGFFNRQWRLQAETAGGRFFILAVKAAKGIT
jgi:hypothetical protein